MPSKKLSYREEVLIIAQIAKYSILFSLLTLPCAQATTGNCFTAHLQEAISLNNARYEQYAKLTHGKSKALSRLLIWSETITLWFFAAKIDRQAQPFQAAGSEVICDAFVSMSKVPPFAEQFAEGAPRPEHFLQLDWRTIKKDLSALIAERIPAQIQAQLASILQRLSQETRYNCMARHLFESMLKIIDGISLHQGPEQELVWQLLSMHLHGFWITKLIDQMAMPLQTANVPIICQDVPPLRSP